MKGEDFEAEIDRLPVDLLAHIFYLMNSFRDMAQASGVCRKWKQGVEESLATREKLSFSGWKTDDDSTIRIVSMAYSLKDLDISKSRWGCRITDDGLERLCKAKCIRNLVSLSLWGLAEITDGGVVQLISQATSLQHLNIGATYVTDEALFAISDRCPYLRNLVLWGCRQVTEDGLVALVNKCRKLESINVWGLRVPFRCFVCLRVINPALRIQPEGTGHYA